MTKEDQLQKLRIFFSGEAFRQMVPKIETTHRPFMIRTPDQNPWQVTRDEAEQTLHEFAPSLSLTISGSTMVIFMEK